MYPPDCKNTCSKFLDDMIAQYMSILKDLFEHLFSLFFGKYVDNFLKLLITYLLLLIKQFRCRKLAENGTGKLWKLRYNRYGVYINMWCFLKYEGKKEEVMRKKIVAIMLASMLAVSATACGGSGDGSSTNDTAQEADSSEDSAPAEDSAEDASEEVTYQSILDDYTQQIKDATPGLIEEYNAEAEEAGSDINKLAEISTAKVEKLAEISTKGTEEMAALMTANGDEYETYEEWAGKLYDVYEEYAGQITDAYMDSASNMSAEDMLESLQ